VALDAVDRFLLHQGSRYIVDAVAKRLGFPEKCGFHAAEYGNTVSSSLPIMLERNVTTEDRVLVLSGFGVGLSCASTVLKRV
jgi:3-oxoacyl-[acyl-carrier-protein] synthase-3